MESKGKDVHIRDIWEARKRIAPMIKKTPLIPSPILSEKADSSIYLKLENLHDIGAFKVRGAANKILSLSTSEQERGVTTFSTGNHGMAVAYVANKLGIRAVICISKRVPNVKVDAIRRIGAEVEIYGESQDEACFRCEQLEKQQGLTVIKPFDDPAIIAGQGTIGLELLEDMPDLDMAIIPLSGGGLLAGTALALKATDPNITITGVSMERAAVMHESLKVGKPVVVQEEYTLADSLLGGIGRDNRYTFRMVRQLMDNNVLLTEKEIADGMGFIAEQHRMIVEGAAATGVAAVLANKVNIKHKKVVMIVSGNNVDLSVMQNVIETYKS